MAMKMILSNKKQQTMDTHNKIEASENNNAERKKPHTYRKAYFCDPTYIQLYKQLNMQINL